MCVVSMVADHYDKKWGQNFPSINNESANSLRINMLQGQLEQLRKEFEEFKELWKKAAEYDKQHNQPHCEQEEKLKILRKVAEVLDINIDDVLKDINVQS